MADRLQGVEGIEKFPPEKNYFSIKEKGEWNNAKRSNVTNNTNCQISNPNFQKKFGTSQFPSFKKFSRTQSNFKRNATRDQKGPNVLHVMNMDIFLMIVHILQGFQQIKKRD
jgi:hypothetical protein